MLLWLSTYVRRARYKVSTVTNVSGIGSTRDVFKMREGKDGEKTEKGGRGTRRGGGQQRGKKTRGGKLEEEETKDGDEVSDGKE